MQVLAGGMRRPLSSQVFASGIYRLLLLQAHAAWRALTPWIAGALERRAQTLLPARNCEHLPALEFHCF